MKKILNCFLGLVVALGISCNGNSLSNKDSFEQFMAASTDSVLSGYCWESDSIPGYPMGGWLLLSFRSDKKAFLTTYCYDSDDLAVTDTGLWQCNGKLVNVFLLNDTITLYDMGKEKFAIMGWKSYNIKEESIQRAIVLERGFLKSLKTLCGEFTSIVDGLTRIKILEVEGGKVLVELSQPNKLTLKFLGDYVNGCIVLGLSQNFKNRDGYIVVRRNESNQIDLNYYIQSKKSDIELDGIVRGEYR